MQFTTSTYTDTGDIYKKKEGKKVQRRSIYIGQQVLRAVIADVLVTTNITDIADVADIVTDITDIATDIADIAVETGRRV